MLRHTLHVLALVLTVTVLCTTCSITGAAETQVQGTTYCSHPLFGGLWSSVAQRNLTRPLILQRAADFDNEDLGLVPEAFVPRLPTLDSTNSSLKASSSKSHLHHDNHLKSTITRAANVLAGSNILSTDLTQIRGATALLWSPVVNQFRSENSEYTVLVLLARHLASCCRSLLLSGDKQI